MSKLYNLSKMTFDGILTNLLVSVLLYLFGSREKVGAIKMEDMSATQIEVELRKHGIIPDVIDERESPAHIIQITYTYKDRNDTRRVEFGNELLPMDLYYYPNHVEWPGYFENDYSLVMVDPDAPSRQDPSQRELCHWLLVNVPGNELYVKETLFDYIGPRPRQGTGFHRYVFIVYEQPKADMNFSEPRLYNDLMDVRRTRFSTRKFARKYSFPRPVAVNFFYARVI